MADSMNPQSVLDADVRHAHSGWQVQLSVKPKNGSCRPVTDVVPRSRIRPKESLDHWYSVLTVDSDL